MLIGARLLNVILFENLINRKKDDMKVIIKVISGIAKYTCTAFAAAVIILVSAALVVVGIEDNEMPL